MMLMMEDYRRQMLSHHHYPSINSSPYRTSRTSTTTTTTTSTQQPSISVTSNTTMSTTTSVPSSHDHSLPQKRRASMESLPHILTSLSQSLKSSSTQKDMSPQCSFPQHATATPSSASASSFKRSGSTPILRRNLSAHHHLYDPKDHVMFLPGSIASAQSPMILSSCSSILGEDDALGFFGKVPSSVFAHRWERHHQQHHQPAFERTERKQEDDDQTKEYEEEDNDSDDDEGILLKARTATPTPIPGTPKRNHETKNERLSASFASSFASSAASSPGTSPPSAPSRPLFIRIPKHADPSNPNVDEATKGTNKPTSTAITPRSAHPSSSSSSGYLPNPFSWSRKSLAGSVLEAGMNVVGGGVDLAIGLIPVEGVRVRCRALVGIIGAMSGITAGKKCDIEGEPSTPQRKASTSSASFSEASTAKDETAVDGTMMLSPRRSHPSTVRFDLNIEEDLPPHANVSRRSSIMSTTPRSPRSPTTPSTATAPTSTSTLSSITSLVSALIWSTPAPASTAATTAPSASASHPPENEDFLGALRETLRERRFGGRVLSRTCMVKERELGLSKESLIEDANGAQDSGSGSEVEDEVEVESDSEELRRVKRIPSAPPRYGGLMGFSGR
ncbi:hypothetical protein HDU97_007067 [Phlyctochytrium planicorne]|nr:hypothetical protein HDU97_007067 [Phlyctochytrium planicorne]